MGLIYGLFLLGHMTASPQEQCDAIKRYAKKHKLKIDDFVAHSQVPIFSTFKPGDTVIVFSWNCISTDKANLNSFILHALKNDISIYSTTSTYCIDKTKDYKQLLYAFNLYEEIRFNFVSGRCIIGIKKRVSTGKTHGREKGSTNTKHAWDGKEKKILALYAQGESMYAIAKKVNLTAPTIKRFLTTRN